MSVTLLGLEHDDARAIQKKYYREHGTTLQGLMLHHGIDPNDFLEKVHDIDYSWVKAGPGTWRGDPVAAGPQVHLHQWRYPACGADGGGAWGFSIISTRSSTSLQLTSNPSRRPKPMTVSRQAWCAQGQGSDVRRPAAQPAGAASLGMRTVLIVPEQSGRGA
jgi:hypothetical protein